MVKSRVSSDLISPRSIVIGFVCGLLVWTIVAGVGISLLGRELSLGQALGAVSGDGGEAADRFRRQQAWASLRDLNVTRQQAWASLRDLNVTRQQAWASLRDLNVTSVQNYAVSMQSPYDDAHPTKLGFDHVYVVNMETNRRRLLGAISLLRYFNIQYEIWEATTGFSPTVQDRVRKMKQANITYWTTEPEIGCYMTHLALYRDIVKNRYVNALILEDDFDVEPDFRDRMKEVQEMAKDLDYDMLYIGYCGDLEEHDHKLEIRENIGSACTHGYAVSLRGAMRLLMQVTQYPRRSIDDTIVRLISARDIHSYSVVPLLVTQAQVTTTSDLAKPDYPFKRREFGMRAQLGIVDKPEPALDVPPPVAKPDEQKEG